MAETRGYGYYPLDGLGDVQPLLAPIRCDA